MLEPDVVVEVRHAGALEVGVFEGGGRQRTQRWPIEQLEPAGAPALEVLEGSVVERAD
jgi:hypothetical protein